MSASREAVLDALGTVVDPCSVSARAPISVWDMGMVTQLEVADDGVVLITMRATSAMCTVIASIMKSVEDAVATVPGVTDVRVTLRSDSQWTEAALSEKGRLILEGRRAQSRTEVQVRPHEWKTRVRPTPEH